MAVQERVIDEFEQRFGAAPPVVVRAPGRVNLIGEHTDYNDGFVMPMAIERAVYIALRPRTDSTVVIHSLDFGESAEFSLAEPTRGQSTWAEYIKGVAWALNEAGHALKGWDWRCSG
ncbi:MAG: hypothetical protein HC828_09015 [Blastochloris sp.]|nr:hypothetical protein [Blastochloris sp.]